jgi:EAL domain-containing protein (putative c-di-GMP-specific phosphodiesterase class I)
VNVDNQQLFCVVLVASASGPNMAASLDVVAINPKLARAANPLCFLMDEDFVFRQSLAKELRQDGVDVVEFSNSSRLLDMVDDQNPDIVFVYLNSALPHERVRSLWALRECGYSGAVQIFGRCEPKFLESFNTVGADCALTMLTPLQKPVKAERIHQVIQDRKLNTAAASTAGMSLSDALLRNLITFLYQPKFDLRTHTMAGFELVARVAHPKLGLLAPDQFLKGADEDDLLKLSHLALVTALKASAHFRQSGVALVLAINISVENLLRLPIADLVATHRQPGNDWPGLLLEVPQRQVVNKIELLKSRFLKLKQSGVSIAIDNFGRGSTSLDILNQIPFAEVKIDRELVENCATNVGKASICKTLIQMARNFGSQAVAVGISSEADLRTLRSLDCDFGQGFLLGKPMDAQRIDALIASFKSQKTA